MKKLILLNLFLVLGAVSIFAQTVEELKAQKVAKEAELATIQASVADLNKQIKAFPGWSYGGVGIVGADLNANDAWYAINNPNSSANGIGLALSAFANNNAEKYFWRNLLTLNLKRVKTTLDSSLPEDTDGNEIVAITDALDLSSLFGYRLNSKWAISAEGKYTSTLLNFNNPGKLTLSAGATWTPNDALVVIFHPLAYELNFPTGDYVSAPGCKIGATYAATIIPGVAWSSNLSAFVPYSAGEGQLNEFPLDPDKSTLLAPVFNTSATALSSLVVDYSTSDLFNWTWINSFSTNIFRGIGVGLNIGLRQDVQVANQWRYQRDTTFDPVAEDNPLQFFWSLGLSYTL